MWLNQDDIQSIKLKYQITFIMKTILCNLLHAKPNFQSQPLFDKIHMEVERLSIHQQNCCIHVLNCYL